MPTDVLLLVTLTLAISESSSGSFFLHEQDKSHCKTLRWERQERCFDLIFIYFVLNPYPRTTTTTRDRWFRVLMHQLVTNRKGTSGPVKFFQLSKLI